MTRLYLNHAADGEPDSFDGLTGRNAVEPGEAAGGPVAEPGAGGQSRSDQPDLEQARRWRFAHPHDDAARIGHSTDEQAESGTAVSSRGATWEEPPGGSPGWNLFSLLWRRKLRIGAVAALAMACFTAVVFAVPKSYRASSSVIFQGDVTRTPRAEEAHEPAFAPDTLPNEIELLKSEELLTTVVTKLNLTNDSEFTPQESRVSAWLAGVVPKLEHAAAPLLARIGLAVPPPAPPLEDGADLKLARTTDTLRDHLVLEPVGVSRVIRIDVKAHSAALAASIANAMADAYVDFRSAAKTAATQQAHDWIESRIASLRDRALASARAYDALRHAAGAVRGKDGPIRQEQLTQISTDLTQVREQKSTIQLALAQAPGSGDAELDMLTSASGSPLMPKLREALAVATARRAELGAYGGILLPSVVANRALVQDITRSIERERTRIRKTLQTKLAVLTSREDELTATLNDLTEKVEQADSSSAEIQALQRASDADADMYRSVVAQAEQTDPDLNYQLPSVRILSRASPPLWPSSPNKRVILPVALILSLGLGVAVAFVREATRRGVFNLRDLPRPAGQSPLGMLPFVRRGDRPMEWVWDEAVAQILARMLLPNRGIIPASVVVTSALPREGRTKVAIALAHAAKNRGLRVLLIDADLRGRGATKAAGLLDSHFNLVRLLLGEIEVDTAPTECAEWGFSVLPAGRLSGSPVNLLATQAWAQVLRDLEGLFDLVIVDTPPALAAGDAWMLARPADATVLVVEWGQTSVTAIEQAVEQLAAAPARTLGLVLTKVVHQDHASSGPDDTVMFSPKLLQYHTQRRLR